MNRRRFLVWAGAGLAVGGTVYTYARGLRFPLLHFAGTGPVTRWRVDGVEVEAKGAMFQAVEDEAFRFRAFVPEPELRVRIRSGRSARVVVDNLHADAAVALDRSGASSRRLHEERGNLTRSLSLKASGDAEIALSWRFPKPKQYRFAAIGDSGGGTELQWVLKRAAELGADFLVHLGDFNYQPGDLDRAALNLNAAAIPTYAAIGNHDFHSGWNAVYPKFNELIGPNNSVFALGGVEFVNIDTAAAFFPAVRGRRAHVIQNLRPIGGDAGLADRVVFTHKPLNDPDPERQYEVNRAVESRWLRERLLDRGSRVLLAGHIHIKDEFDDQGLYTYISGQGLAHADLIVQRPYAEILLGDVSPGERVRYQWEPLRMPFEAHCNERNLGLLDILERPDAKAKLIEQCGNG